MVEPIPENRAKIIEDEDTLIVSFPVRKVWSSLILLIAFFLLWTFGIFAILVSFIVNDHQLSIIPLSYTLIWLLLFIVLAWKLYGKDEIVIEGQNVALRKKLLFLSYSKNFALEKIHSLNFKRDSLLSNNIFMNSIPTYWGYSSGSISFSTGKKNVLMSDGVDDAEALYIFELIKKRIVK
ncbi:MAG: hypothetical protein LAT67_12230 [Balneolales bacterium]|nr:hypothetical protein [Balneolales bacterium]